MNVRLVRGDEALANKSRLEGLVEKVMTPRTGWTPDDLWNDIATERSQLWVVGDFEGFCTTNIEVRTRGRFLWVAFLAGQDYRAWIDNLVEALSEYAVAHRCIIIEFLARPGFERVPETKKHKCKHIQSLFQIDMASRKKTPPKTLPNESEAPMLLASP